MTHHTDAERAEFEAWARGYGTWEVKRDDDVALGTTGYTDITLTVAWHAVQAARRAPVAPVPQEPTSKQVVLGAGALLGQPEHTADNRHPEWHSAVEKVRKVYLAMLAAAPQPPAAAPVELPEPVAIVTGTTPRNCGWKTFFVPEAGTKLYTEQQVRDLLAAAKVERKPLTDVQISLAAHNIDDGDWNNLVHKNCWHSGFYEGAREAERAHGIGKDKA